jgi:hypothetical protein
MGLFVRAFDWRQKSSTGGTTSSRGAQSISLLIVFDDTNDEKNGLIEVAFTWLRDTKKRAINVNKYKGGVLSVICSALFGVYCSLQLANRKYFQSYCCLQITTDRQYVTCCYEHGKENRKIIVINR